MSINIFIYIYTVYIYKCRGLEPAIFRLRGKGVSITLARMDQFIYNLGVVLSDSTGATGLPRKSSWRWRLESYVRAYGELHTANPVHSRTAAKRRSGTGSENCVGWKLLARYVTVMREGGPSLPAYFCCCTGPTV